MAIFHLSVSVIARSCGRSAVCAAAYRAAARLVDERLGQVHDYRHKRGVGHLEILAPEGAPGWATDRQRLWNAAEHAEKRVDGRPAREIRIGLPAEISDEAQLDAVRTFLQDHVVSRGMTADLAIHRDNPDNPHAHILITTRPWIGGELGNKDRSWNSKDVVSEWRQGWEVVCNRALARAGLSVRIDHRSHEDRGLDILPTRKIGVPRQRLGADRRDVVAERIASQEKIAQENAERVLEDPRRAFDVLTEHEPVFTRAHVAQWLNTRVSPELLESCLERMMASSDLVTLGTHPYRGRDVELYTTPDMLASETRLLLTAEKLDQSGERGTVSEVEVKGVGDALSLSEEQSAALRYVTRETGDLALLQGHAGTGKSHLFRGATALWEAQGRRVLGAAVAAKAATGLGESANIRDCRSLAAWEYAWDAGRATLQRGDVLVVDEAGMLGTRQTLRLLERADKAGAKLVLAGDAQQLQAIEAGGAFAALEATVGSVQVSQIRRQQTAWMRDATAALAAGKAGTALDAYQGHGYVKGHKTQDEALHAVAMATATACYFAHSNHKTVLALASTRAEVAALNAQIRASYMHGVRHSAGHDVLVQTAHGERGFAVGDRLCFSRNDRSVGVTNGSLGTVVAADNERLRVRLDAEKREVDVHHKQWGHFDWGYAMTVHRAQGATVDEVLVLAGRGFDAHGLYVAMSRHRQEVRLKWSEEVFKDFSGLRYFAGRTQSQKLALDYDYGRVEEKDTLDLSTRLGGVDRAALLRGEYAQAVERLGRDHGVFDASTAQSWLKHYLPTGADLESQARGLLTAAGVVPLGHNRHGHALYTTQRNLEADKRLAWHAEALCKAAVARVDARTVGHACAKGQTGYGESHAVRFALREANGLAILRSHDFASKNRVITALDHAYRQSGARVMGLAKDEQAARYMRVGRDACDTRSLASWQKAWSTGQDRIRAGDVLLVEQAQNLSRQELAYVLERVSQAGGRVVLLDDTRYLTSSRSAATELGEQVGHHRLDAGTRQRGGLGSDRASVAALGTQPDGRAEKALLQDMQARGAATAWPSREKACAALAASWAQDEMCRRGSSMALAMSRSDANALNKQLRGVAESHGWLGKESTLACRTGPKIFAVGDRVIFTEKSSALGIVKGSLGEIVQMDKSRVTVRLDREVQSRRDVQGNDATDRFGHSRLRTFHAGSFKGMDHGYATTIAAAQNLHVERSYVLATPGLDRERSRVALSRHTERAQCFYSSIDFRAPGALSDRVSRPGFDAVGDLRADFVRQEQGRVQEQARAEAQRAQKQAQATELARAAAREREEDERVRTSYREVSERMQKVASVARQRLPSLGAQIQQDPAVVVAKAEYERAVSVRIHFAHHVNEQEAQAGTLQRWGLARPEPVRDPVTGGTIQAKEGLKRAWQAERELEKHISVLCESPEVVARARRELGAKQEIISRAQTKLPELERHFEAARKAFDRVIAKEMAQEKSRERGLDRGPDLGR